MKRTIALLALAAAASTVPASADDPSATARIRDTGGVQAEVHTGDGVIGLYLTFERVTTPEAGLDPNGLFPIVIDPNNPPEPPASATSETWSLQGYVYMCDWNVGWCEDRGLTSADASLLSIEDSPLAGNAMHVTGMVALPSGPVEVDLRAAKPQVTRLWTDNTIVHPNVWQDGSDVHAGTDTYAPLLTRHTYSVTGTIDAPLGGGSLTYGGASFNRDAQAFTSADATLPV